MQGGGGGGATAPTLNSREIGRNQARQNTQAAIASATMNNTNQITPYGSLKYTQTGGYTDENDQFIPQFTAEQTLSPRMQGLFDQRTGASEGLFNFANAYSPSVFQGINRLDYSPLKDTGQYENEAYRALTARGSDAIAQAERAAQVQAANQGVATGSEAYNRALQPIGQQRVDLANQATINANQLANQYQQRDITGRQFMNQQNLMPLQIYNDLLTAGSGGQAQPNYISTPQTNVNAADVTSPALAAFDAQNKAYQQQQQQAQNGSNALMGSLFGLGGSVLGGIAGGPLGASIGGSLFGGLAGGPSSIGGMSRGGYQGAGSYRYG